MLDLESPKDRFMHLMRSRAWEQGNPRFPTLKTLILRILWICIFHVCPYSMVILFFYCENLIFEKGGIITYFIFLKRKQNCNT